MRLDDNGLHIRQSEIADWLMCPEQFRRNLVNQLVNPRHDLPVVDHNGDAALCGTAVHAAIEYDLNNTVTNFNELIEHGVNTYMAAAETFRHPDNKHLYTFNESTFKGNDNKARHEVASMIAMYWDSEQRHELHYVHDDYKTEWEFDVPFTRVRDTQVWLTGTADIVIPDFGVDDWKSSGREYERWEKQRWAVQPTVYTFAAAYEGLIKADKRDMYHFRYQVFPRGRKSNGIETVAVTRTGGHFAWLAEQIVPLVYDVMDGWKIGWPDPWQKNDQHVLCSDKWCPEWDTCKGAAVGVNWKEYK